MLSAAKKAEEAKARIEAKRQERMAEVGGAKEAEEEEKPKSRTKTAGKSPRVGRGDAAAAVAGLDLDALIGGDDKPKKKSSKKAVAEEEGEEEEEQAKPRKTTSAAASKRRVGKDEAQAALAGIDLDSIVSGKKK